MNAVDNFHEGQRIALEERDNVKALDFFREALKKTEQIGDKNENYKDWQRYIKGTIAYFEKNLIKLEEAFREVSEPKNKAVLERLMLGLKINDNINYQRDYLPK